MRYKRKIKSTSDLSELAAKKLNLDSGQSKQVASLYVEKIKESILKGKKVSLSEFGTFELTKWRSQGIYNITLRTKEQREIKTVLFKASPILKKKIAD